MNPFTYKDYKVDIKTDILPIFLNNDVPIDNSLEIPEIFPIESHPITPQIISINNPNVYLINLTSDNLLDPFSLKLSVKVTNLNDFNIKVEDSAHSLIKKITVFCDSKIVEEIENYPELMRLEHLLTLGQKERSARRSKEGFGTNEYGTDELPILAKNDTYFDSSVINKGINDLAFIENGLISFKVDDHFENNFHVFEIPLHLKTIGSGLTKKNHKFLPLSVFKDLFISIEFTKEYIIDASEVAFSDLMTNSKITFNQVDKNKVILSEVKILTTQYRYSKEYMDYWTNVVSNGEWVVSFKELKVSCRTYIDPAYEYTLTRVELAQKIKSILIAFSKVPDIPNQQRKFTFFNPSIKDLTFKYGPVSLPISTEGHIPKVYNSLTNFGLENCFKFYKEIRDVIGPDSTLITPKTFCIKSDFSNDGYLGSFFNIERVNTFNIYKNTQFMRKSKYPAFFPTSDLNEYFDQPTSLALFAINFEIAQYSSNRYRTEFKLDMNIPYQITIKRHNIEPQEKILCTTYFQKYKTLKLNNNGLFEEIFV